MGGWNLPDDVSDADIDRHAPGDWYDEDDEDDGNTGSCTHRSTIRRAGVDPQAQWAILGPQPVPQRDPESGRHRVDAQFVHCLTRQHVRISYWLQPDDPSGKPAGHYKFWSSHTDYKALCQILNSHADPRFFDGLTLPVEGLEYERTYEQICAMPTSTRCDDPRCSQWVCRDHRVGCDECLGVFHVACSHLLMDRRLCRVCLSKAADQSNANAHVAEPFRTALNKLSGVKP